MKLLPRLMPQALVGSYLILEKIEMRSLEKPTLFKFVFPLKAAPASARTHIQAVEMHTWSQRERYGNCNQQRY
jgi:hypothetical protein